jgi:NADP-dependent 3-hydroxy acid dehydrogenase YdfG
VSAPFALVVGAGPGVSAALARRLGAAGFRIGLVARDEQRLAELAAPLRAEGVDARTAAADAGDADALTQAVAGLAREAGRLDVLHYNPSQYRAGGATEVSASDLLDDLAVGAAGLLTAVRAGLPHLLDRGGTVTATGSGAADRPMRGALTLGVQKAALRALVQGLALELTPRGVHVATVTVRGTVRPDTPFSPDAVAAALAGLVEQTAGPREAWTTLAELTRDGLRVLA